MRLGPTLTSIQNPTIKSARSLQRKRVRNRERALLVEGVRLFSDCVTAGAVPAAVFLDETRFEALVERLEAQLGDALVFPVSARVLASLSETETPQGVIAVLPFPDLSLPPQLRHPGLLLIADAVQDPGNLGTLIRAAVGAGADAVYVSPDTVDPYSAKVMRAGMSAQYRVPIRPLDWHDLPDLIEACPQRIAAEAGVLTSYDNVDWTGSSCLVVGNEAHGLSGAARRTVTQSVSIPLARGLESLNVAVAGSVILFEAARQRRTASQRPA